ncbi:MAG: hypothetical protein UW06_C0018G0004 [Parcubacteria group bacterium GW2011_GWE1_43_8]|nr:MAG: hypothetical protein UW06_C0018G0004 [Parcubacteria group bacterium GW2011_GWE1_43_8]
MDTTPANTPASNEVSDDKVFAAMSYLWVLCLLPLLMKRNRPFVQFHAKQGFLLFLFEVVIWVLMFIPPLYFIGMLAAVVLSIMGLVSAITGKEWEMPVLGKYAKSLKF